MAKWFRHPPIRLNGGMRLDLATSSPEAIPLGWHAKLVNVHHAVEHQLTEREPFEQWEDGLSLATIAYGIFSLYKPTGVRYRVVFDVKAATTTMRMHYIQVGDDSWSNVEDFLETGFHTVRGTRLRNTLYFANGQDDLRFFASSSSYGKAGVFPPTAQPTTTFSSDPSTDATDDDALDIETSGFLQYCLTFRYTDPETGEPIHESPASAMTDLVNCHWGDADLTANEHYGYVKRGLDLTIPTNSDVDSDVDSGRIKRRKIYRRYKAYADVAWGDWTEVQELYNATHTTWVDMIDTPSGDLDINTNVPPPGKLIASAANRVFLGNLKDRATRQPSLSSTWRSGTGYTPKWPYRMRVDITDPNASGVVTRGIAHMKFTNDAAHSSSVDPDASDDGAYLTGMAGVDFRDIPTAEFVGAGLDDLTTSGTYSGVLALRYVVEIDAGGAPDTFKWSDDGGATWDALGVAITGAAQALNNGVSVTFAAVTGHTLADYWTFLTVRSDFVFTADDGITEIGHVVQAATANDILFYVEIPQLQGTASVYLYYGDTNAPPFEEAQWESVFHKLYATNDMLALCNFDVSVTQGDFADDACERILGRVFYVTDQGAAWGTSDGGYCDDNELWAFSSGKRLEIADHGDYGLLAFHSDGATKIIEHTHGTIQLWAWVDFSELQAAGADNNVFSFTNVAGNATLRGVIEQDGANWYFQLYDATPATLITDNGNLGIALPGLTGDMWLFISVAWGTASTSLTYIDSADFGAGPVSSINYDSSGLQVAVYSNIRLGHTADSMEGYYDEFVVWDHEKNTAAEIDAQYKRLSYWETALQMEVDDEEEIYNTTDDVPIRTARPSRLTWSNNSAPDIFQTANFRASDSGAELTGLVAFAGNIIALYMNELRVLNTATPTQEALFAGNITDPVTEELIPITEMWTLSSDKTAEIRNLGCIAPDSVEATDNYVLFYGLAGLYAYAVRGFYHLSKALDTTLKAIPIEFRREIQGKVYPEDDQYWMSVVSGDSTGSDQTNENSDAAEAFGEAAANNVKIAQSFVPDHPLLADVELEKRASTGTFTGTVTISIQADDDGEPDGHKIAYYTYTNTAWEALSDSANFSTDMVARLTPGETYWIVLESSTSDNANHPNVGIQTGSDEYADGAAYEHDDTSWAEVAGDDLYFDTIYAYHDKLYVLDLQSVGQDPDAVRWTEFRWGDTDYLNARSFAVLDDVGDTGEILFAESDDTKMWKYGKGPPYQDDGSDDIQTIVQTGKIDLRDCSVRRVKTHYDLLDPDGDQQDNLTLYMPNQVMPSVVVADVISGEEELLPRGSLFNFVQFEWQQATEYALRLREVDFEYRLSRRKRLRADSGQSGALKFLEDYEPNDWVVWREHRDASVGGGAGINMTIAHVGNDLEINSNNSFGCLYLIAVLPKQWMHGKNVQIRWEESAGASVHKHSYLRLYDGSYDYACVGDSGDDFEDAADVPTKGAGELVTEIHHPNEFVRVTETFGSAIDVSSSDLSLPYVTLMVMGCMWADANYVLEIEWLKILDEDNNVILTYDLSSSTIEDDTTNRRYGFTNNP